MIYKNHAWLFCKCEYKPHNDQNIYHVQKIPVSLVLDSEFNLIVHWTLWVYFYMYVPSKKNIAYSDKLDSRETEMDRQLNRYTKQTNPNKKTEIEYIEAKEKSNTVDVHNLISAYLVQALELLQLWKCSKPS